MFVSLFNEKVKLFLFFVFSFSPSRRHVNCVFYLHSTGRRKFYLFICCWWRKISQISTAK
uniref:Uncharacterized protein n=1 Tax=Octopus bimaculoides TaxID=37653 RepID=A0A0L8H8W4_OCTBM